MKNLLDTILAITQKASDRVLYYYQKQDIDVKYKSDQSPLTAADIESNSIICNELKAAFSYPILSEESKDDLTRLQEKRVWLVDPLDGTKEFLSKNGEFTINIALIENQQPILGVVSVPAKNSIYYAERGKGAYVKYRGGSKSIVSGEHLQHKDKISKLMVSNCKNLKNAKISLSRSHLDPKLKIKLNQYDNLQIVSMGSALKYCGIAEGVIDGSIRKTPLYEWDIAASDCILSEAGGLITSFSGEPLIYNQANSLINQGIIASNQLLHVQFYNIVQSIGMNLG